MYNKTYIFSCTVQWFLAVLHICAALSPLRSGRVHSPCVPWSLSISVHWPVLTVLHGGRPTMCAIPWLASFTSRSQGLSVVSHESVHYFLKNGESSPVCVCTMFYQLMGSRVVLSFFFLWGIVLLYMCKFLCEQRELFTSCGCVPGVKNTHLLLTSFFGSILSV